MSEKASDISLADVVALASRTLGVMVGVVACIFRFIGWVVACRNGLCNIPHYAEFVSLTCFVGNYEIDWYEAAGSIKTEITVIE